MRQVEVDLKVGKRKGQSYGDVPRESEGFSDVALNGPFRRGGHSEHGSSRKSVHEPADLPIGRAKPAPPRRNAVGFIDHDETGRIRVQGSHESGIVESLGRRVEQL